MNTQGIGIERLYGRTIMASFHGGWSLAACLGALIGFIMIVSGVTPFWHFTLIALLIVMIVLVSRKYLQEDVAVESPEEEKEALWSPELGMSWVLRGLQDEKSGENDQFISLYRYFIQAGIVPG